MGVCVCIYLMGVCIAIGGVCIAKLWFRNYHNRSIIYTKRTLRSLLTNVKLKACRSASTKVNGVVYKIYRLQLWKYMHRRDCQDPGCYRLKEHKRACSRSNNGIAVHANKTLHDIRWDSAEVLEQLGDQLDQTKI
jgi:hypothetical protein